MRILRANGGATSLEGSVLLWGARSWTTAEVKNRARQQKTGQRTGARKFRRDCRCLAAAEGGLKEGVRGCAWGLGGLGKTKPRPFAGTANQQRSPWPASQVPTRARGGSCGSDGSPEWLPGDSPSKPSLPDSMSMGQVPSLPFCDNSPLPANPDCSTTCPLCISHRSVSRALSFPCPAASCSCCWELHRDSRALEFIYKRHREACKQIETRPDRTPATTPPSIIPLSTNR